MTSVRNNLLSFTQKLPESCRLIAVSKTHPAETIMEAYNAGHRAFGENRVQELVPKHESLPKDIEWHLIGHLQTNKVKYIAGFVTLIQSVDSVRLLQEINRQGARAGRIIRCLLQVHIATEETKFGFNAEEVENFVRSQEAGQMENIRVDGLMGMATLTDDKEQIRNEFRSLRKLFLKLQSSPLPPNVAMRELSMGMSSDYEIAVSEGSTMVRVGSAIFGHRNYAQS